MPVIKSAKKRVLQSEKRRLKNIARKSDVRTAIKKLLDAVERNAIDQAKVLLRDVQAKLARGRGKGVYHRNTVARKMSRLSKRVRGLETPVSTESVKTL